MKEADEEHQFSDLMDAVNHITTVHSKEISNDFVLFPCDEKTEEFMCNIRQTAYFLRDFLTTEPIQHMKRTMDMAEEQAKAKRIKPYQKYTKDDVEALNAIARSTENVLIKRIEFMAVLRRNRKDNFIAKGILKMLNEEDEGQEEDDSILGKLKEMIGGGEKKEEE